MKKLNVILLILSFILSGIGSIFLFDAKTSTNDSIQTIAPSNKIESEEVTEYTYKTYEDYFIDYFNLPAETYTRDETTGVVTIDYTKITRTTTKSLNFISKKTSSPRLTENSFFVYNKGEEKKAYNFLIEIVSHFFPICNSLPFFLFVLLLQAEMGYTKKHPPK